MGKQIKVKYEEMGKIETTGKIVEKHEEGNEGDGNVRKQIKVKHEETEK